MSSALDASPLTCSNCAAARFGDLWNLRFEKAVALLFDSEILLERCCFLSELFFLKPGFLPAMPKKPVRKEKTAKFRKTTI